MRPPTPSDEVIRFAEFEANLRTGELRRDGAKVPIDGQPFRLLHALLLNPAALVTREDLRRALWPDGTIVDFDHGINESAKRLRQALDDSAAKPRFIETLRGRGYRFIFPLEHRRKSRQKRWLGILAAVAAIGIAVLRVGTYQEAAPSPGFAPAPPPGMDAIDPAAYEALLKAHFYLEKGAEEGILRGVSYFRQALEIDPTLAHAWAGLADGYNRAAIRHIHPPQDAYPIARAAAERALALDETLTEGHVVAGVVKFRFDRDWTGAERDLRRALELSPNSSRARLAYGTYLLALGQVDAAIEQAVSAVDADPVAPQRHLNLGWTLQHAGRHQEAIDRFEIALELMPDSALIHALMGVSQLTTGAYDGAKAGCDAALKLSDENEILSACGVVYAGVGENARSEESLGKLLGRNPAPAYFIALVYNALGDGGKTLRWLQRAVEERAPEACFLSIGPWSDRVRTDPRFPELVRQIGYPEIQSMPSSQ